MGSTNVPVIMNQPNSIGPADQATNQNGANGNVAVVTQPPPAYRNRNGVLDPLAASERIIIKQHHEMLEVVLGCETENKYEILDEQNQLLYNVDETSEFCMRCWCGPLRPIFVNVRDADGNLAMYMERPLACQEICFPCCLQKLIVQSPPGNIIGTVEQKWGVRPEFDVRDSNGSVVFVVKGPLCQFSCRCGDVEFPIFASDGGSECGKISKQWRGVIHEALTDADIFGVQFPPGINPSMKALLIAATFLVDYMYFESNTDT